MRNTLCAGTLLLALAASLALGADPRDPASPATRPAPAPPAPERTDEGDWNGTWYYASRTTRLALWIRTENGLPEIKMRYFGVGAVESFVTDWNGHASYEHKNLPGEFTLEIDERDANTMRGSWRWTLGDASNGRIETTRFTMYRAGDGRQIVMVLEDYRKVYKGVRDRLIEADQLWSFRKASRREVLWTELPL